MPTAAIVIAWETVLADAPIVPDVPAVIAGGGSPPPWQEPFRLSDRLRLIIRTDDEALALNLF
jgi:hypothetical protein